MTPAAIKVETSCKGFQQNGAVAYGANTKNNNRCHVDCSNRGALHLQCVAERCPQVMPHHASELLQ